MTARQIVPGVFELPLGIVNVFFLQAEDGWVLFDAGLPGMADQILSAFQQLGHTASDLRHIIITHAHPDHIGSLAALKQATGATIYAHTLDVPIIEASSGFRPLKAAPSLLKKLMFRAFIRPAPPIEGCPVDYEVCDGEVLPIAGGLTAIHTPGHCAGHLSFFWPKQSVLFVADACGNMPSLGWSIGYEDVTVGRQSLEKLAKLDFAVACFGHGKSIQPQATKRFRARWKAR